MIKNSSRTPAGRKNSSPAKSKNKSAESKNIWKSTMKYCRTTLVYLLAVYGAHSLAERISPDYRDFSRKQSIACAQLLSVSARNVEQKLAPMPTLVIKNQDDAAASSYDNLSLGVPSWECDVILDRVGYALGYSERYEQPLWVSYKLTAEEVKSSKARRSDDFRSDPDIPGKSADPDDYKGSFYDRGHLAAAADMSFSLQAMSESFYMSNMSPQRPELNRGSWKKLEAKVRDYAAANGAVYVISGPIFDRKLPNITIGRNKVAVPDKYYKVLLDTNSITPKAIGFILENRECNKDLSAYAVTVDAVEAISGLNFFDQLDPEDERKLESQCDYRQWEQSLPIKKRSGKRKR